MVVTLQNILESITSLEIEELDILISQANSAKQFLTKEPKGSEQIKKASKTISNEELFHMQVSEVFNERGLSCPPWTGFKRMRIHSLMKNKFPEIESYTTKFFGVLKRYEKQKLYRIYSEVLIDWMQGNQKIPMKIGVFYTNLGSITALMEDSFPGYARLGWLPLILQMGRRDHRSS